MKVRMLIATAFLLAAGFAAWSEDPPPAKTEPALERAELDKRAAKVAHDSSKLGSDLWTAGEIEGCFRLYQGTGLALEPMLDHRPKLAAFAKAKLEAAKDLRADKGAFVLREALDAIQKECSGAKGRRGPREETGALDPPRRREGREGRDPRPDR